MSPRSGSTDELRRPAVGPHVFDVGQALRPGENEIRVRIANLINNSYGEPAESGLLGPVRLVVIR